MSLLVEHNLEVIGIPRKGNSKDRKNNNHGHRLIELCKSQSMIANGRLGNYLERKLSCKEASVVDYAIFSPCLFPINFDVLDFDENLSDIHKNYFFGQSNLQMIFEKRNKLIYVIKKLRILMHGPNGRKN